MPLDREDTSSVQHDESKDIDERPTAGFKSNALGSSCTQHEVSCYSQFSMHIEGDIATFLHHATTPSLRDRPTRVAGTLTTCQTSIGSCIQKSHQTLAPPRSHDKHGLRRVARRCCWIVMGAKDAHLARNYHRFHLHPCPLSSPQCVRRPLGLSEARFP